jgi:hypothetical protein
MKTDRELLELAAKAAGISDPSGVRSDGAWWWYNSTMDGQGAAWNPLTDDGDALRLAVSLRMDLNINDGECDVFTPDSFYHGRGEDTLETTRRAIVRAAAAIGEAMQ